LVAAWVHALLLEWVPHARFCAESCGCVAESAVTCNPLEKMLLTLVLRHKGSSSSKPCFFKYLWLVDRSAVVQWLRFLIVIFTEHYHALRIISFVNQNKIWKSLLRWVWHKKRLQQHKLFASQEIYGNANYTTPTISVQRFPRESGVSNAQVFQALGSVYLVIAFAPFMS